MHLDDVITEAAAQFPQRLAVSCESGEYTYAELNARVDRVASGLRNLGLVPGDRLAYQLDNHRIEALVTLFAALRAGLTVVPLFALRQGPMQVAYALRHGGVRALVTQEKFLERLAPEHRAGLEWIVTVGSTVTGAIGFEALPYEPTRSWSQGAATEDAIGLLVFTSGTTSRPKGVAHTQLRLSYRVDLFVEEMELTEQDATVIVQDIGRPVIFMGQVLAMLRVGGQIALAPAGDPAAFWRAYGALGKASYVICGPGAAFPLLDHPAAREVSHRALRYWICGGDRVLPALHALSRTVLGKPIYEMCGMTEVGFYAITPPHAEIRLGSVGRVMQGCVVRIVDAQGGEVATGEVGEILVRTPNTMFGYWNDTLATFRAFMDRWIRSGDLGRIDADGYLWIVGRAKLMLSRGGAKVAPPMVEDALREHPDILEAAVVGQSDPVQGQVPFAFYELRKGASDPGADRLRDWVRARLDSASVPETFVRVEHWPFTAQGKLDRSRLTLLAEAGGEQG